MLEAKQRMLDIDWLLKELDRMPDDEVLANPDAGKFTAIIATLNVVDLDEDVVLTESVGRQDAAIAAWGHGWHLPCVGRGVVFEDKNQLKAEGEFLLQTQAGRDHYFTVRMMKELQEWSFGLDVQESSWEMRDHTEVRLLHKIQVVEFSPCMRGAGVGTMTLNIKDSQSDSPARFVPTRVLKAERYAEKKAAEQAALFAKQQATIKELDQKLAAAQM